LSVSAKQEGSEGKRYSVGDAERLEVVLQRVPIADGNIVVFAVFAVYSRTLCPEQTEHHDAGYESNKKRFHPFLWSWERMADGTNIASQNSVGGFYRLVQLMIPARTDRGTSLPFVDSRRRFPRILLPFVDELTILAFPIVYSDGGDPFTTSPAMTRGSTVTGREDRRYSQHQLRKIMGHLVFWVLYVVINGLRTPNLRGGWLQVIIEAMMFLPVIMGATYFTLYVLVQKFFLRGRHIQFALYLVISAFCFSSVSRAISYYIVVPMYFPDRVATFQQGGLFNPTSMIAFVLSLYSVVAYAGVILFVWKWYENEKAKQQLAKEKLEAELRFLRAQIHPHFLFNMLNNVYALSLRKSDQTPHVILKISSLLDYMLYGSNANIVALQKEVQVVLDYLEIERVRYGNRIQIGVQIEGELDGLQIAPLILFPFVENSFKHGMSTELEKGWINLSIRINDGTLRARIENSKSKYVEPEQWGTPNGIGYRNVLRRLDLLYPGRYTLDAVDKGWRFIVDFTVQLKSPPEVWNEDSVSLGR
jgi:hypothetical protein